MNEWISCEQTNKLYIDGRLKAENVQQNLIDGIFCCKLPTHNKTRYVGNSDFGYIDENLRIKILFIFEIMAKGSQLFLG